MGQCCVKVFEGMFTFSFVVIFGVGVVKFTRYYYNFKFKTKCVIFTCLKLLITKLYSYNYSLKTRINLEDLV